MRPGQDIAIILATIFLGFSIWREVVWMRRNRNWRKVTGRVKGFWDSDDGVGGPIIWYPTEGGDNTFEAPYCLSNPNLGEEVEVLYDPSSSTAALLTKRHRWFPTLFCLALFMVMTFITIKTH